ncbi:LamG-like jellyroll fold domain-containing protein [Luteitalea sp.]
MTNNSLVPIGVRFGGQRYLAGNVNGLGPTGFTFTCWTPMTNGPLLFLGDRETDQPLTLEIAINGAAITVDAKVGSTSVNAPTLTDRQPHHVAVSFDQPTGSLAATVVVYVDGHRVGTSSIHMSYDDVTAQSIQVNPVTIGARPHQPGLDDHMVPDQVLATALTDVRLFSRVLTPVEVRQDADELVPTLTGALRLALPLTATAYDVATEAPVDLVTGVPGPISTQVVPSRGGRYGWTGSAVGFPIRSRTFEFRVRAGANDHGTILSYADVSSSDHPNDGGTPWKVTLGGASSGPSIVANLYDGAWHHVAIVIDADEGKGWSYVDGVRVGEASCDVSGTVDGQPLLIGADSTDDDESIFTGLLMDVSLWSTARTAEQVAADAAGTAPADLTGLVAYWSLGMPKDQGLAATAPESGQLTFSSGPDPLPATSLSDGGQPMALVLAVAGDGLMTSAIAEATVGPATPNLYPMTGSIELWVRPSGAGTVLDVTNRRRLAAVTVDHNGQLTTRLMVAGQPLDATVALPSPALGEWHHLAFSWDGSTTTVTVDGEAVSTIAATLPNLRTTDLWFGRSSEVNSPELPAGAVSQLTGSLAEVRIWGRALTLGEIRGGMHHALRGDEPGLIGRWGFERGLGRDRSPDRRRAMIAPSTATSADVVDLEAREGRYLVSQAKLVEDFEFPVATNGAVAGPPTKRNSYRLVITAYEVDGTPVAHLPLTVALQPEPGGPPSTSLAVETADGTVRHAIGDGTPVTLTTNVLGNLSVSLPATDLVAPVLRIRAPFMVADHSLLVFPDRHAHHVLATVTADELRGKARPHSPRGTRAALIGDAHAASAESVATAIRSFMGGAHEQVPQSANPVARSVDLRLLSPLPRPTTRRHENAYVVPQTYGVRNDTASGHAHAGVGLIARQVVPTSTPSTWELVSTGAGLVHNPLTTEQGNQIWSDATLTTHDPVATLLAGHFTKKRGPLTKGDLTAALAAADTQGRERGIFDWFHAIANAAKIVVHAVEAVIGDVAQAVKAVVVFIYDQAQNVVAAVLQTVYDAADAVKGLLSKVAATVEQAIEFVKELFNWSDVIDTQRVMKAQLQSIIPFVRTNLASAQKVVTNVLTDTKRQVHLALEATAAGLTGDLIRTNSGAAAYSPPTDMQSTYLRNLVGDHGAQASITPSGADLRPATGSLADALTAHTNGSTALNTIAGRQGELHGAVDSINRGFAPAAAALTRVLETLSDEFFDLAIACTPAMFAELDAVLASADELLGWRIDIPLITRLYETVIVPGDTLSAYSLGALVGAVPGTILYKLAKGSSTGPFPTGHPALPGPVWPFDGEGKLSPRSTRTLPDPTPEFIHATWGLGGCFLGLMAFSGALGTIVKGLSVGNKLPGGARSPLARVALAFGWLFQLSQIPLDGFRRLNAIGGPASSGIEVGIWLSQFLPVAMDTVTTARPADVQQEAGALRDQIVGFYGLFHWLGFVALVCVENQEDKPLDVDSGLKFLGNTASCVPEADSLFSIARWVVLADAVAYTVWEGVSVGRFVLQYESDQRFLTR